MFLSIEFWKLRELARRIWVRIALISGLALIAVAATPVLGWLLPEGMKDRITEEALRDLLSVLSGSMLAVATFSLSVMVSAHHFAASQVTPRSHRLLRQDGRTQSVLATFIGAFVYAIVAIVLVNAGLFGGRDFAAVYGVTIVVLALVIVALVRWVRQISSLGSIEATTERVESAARAAMEDRMEAPFLGGCALPEDGPPAGTIPVVAQAHGWVRHIDLERLSDLAKTSEARLYLAKVPGDRVAPDDVLIHVETERMSVEAQTEMNAAIVIGPLRDFMQDPGFGIEVLSEIGQRALSPGMNDPRTATHVVWLQLGLLTLWQARDTCKPQFPRLFVPPLRAQALVEGAFDYIARDGAALVEVQVAVQSALAHLARHPDAEMAQAARIVSARALERMDLPLSADAAVVRTAAAGR
ncbi:DUF2254 domain-containing protein [Jannaschia sp. M317]|uniref:DUF2254 domain-containing protein n=1 Tax=Jannaschia sp. M317 TaxID=2867011 RepID=UPI0021A52B50|nr:DUF2254 domain-containing protein [Jannaschia sp. M317]UWQ19055.1 DUF2254 domain-containing protein [Jannaschia sp. M317]